MCPECGANLLVEPNRPLTGDVEELRTALGVVVCACGWRGTTWRAKAPLPEPRHTTLKTGALFTSCECGASMPKAIAILLDEASEAVLLAQTISMAVFLVTCKCGRTYPAPATSR